MLVTLIGGTGFLGRTIARELIAKGHRLHIIGRHPDKAIELKTAGQVGQVVFTQADVTSVTSLKRIIPGSECVINLVGILYEKGEQRFHSLHTELAKYIAQIAKAEGVGQLIHVSALGVDHAKDSLYAQTKLYGEEAVRHYFPEAVILRPSVIFGPEDQFFNLFAKLVRLLPALPLIGGGKTKFQPVYVKDIAELIIQLMEKPFLGKGKIFELGGPEILTLEEIYRYVISLTKASCYLVPIPFWTATLLAEMLQWLPQPPLTPDQVRLLKYDNIIHPPLTMQKAGFETVNIQPKAIETIVPLYITAPNSTPSAAS